MMIEVARIWKKEIWLFSLMDVLSALITRHWKDEDLLFGKEDSATPAFSTQLHGKRLDAFKRGFKTM